MSIVKKGFTLHKATLLGAVFILSLLGLGTKTLAATSVPAVVSMPVASQEQPPKRNIEAFAQLRGTLNGVTSTSSRSDVQYVSGSSSTVDVGGTNGTIIDSRVLSNTLQDAASGPYSLVLHLTFQNTTNTTQNIENANSDATGRGFIVTLPQYYNANPSQSVTDIKSTVTNQLFESAFSGTGLSVTYSSDSFAATTDWATFIASAASHTATDLRRIEVKGTMAPNEKVSVDIPLVKNPAYAVDTTSYASADMIAIQNNSLYDRINFRYADNTTPAIADSNGNADQFLGTKRNGSGNTFEVVPADVQAKMAKIASGDIEYYNFLRRGDQSKSNAAYLYDFNNTEGLPEQYSGSYAAKLSENAVNKIKDSIQNEGYSPMLTNDGSVDYDFYQRWYDEAEPTINGKTENMTSNAKNADNSNVRIFTDTKNAPNVALRQVVAAHDSDLRYGQTLNKAANLDFFTKNDGTQQTTLGGNGTATVSDPNHVLDANGKAVKNGSLNVTYSYEVSSGYTVSKTVKINVTGAPTNATSGGGTTTSNTNQGISSQSNSNQNNTNIGGNTTPTTLGGSNVAAKGEAVYAVKSLYMYKGATFSKSQRRTIYAQKPRINRPMFVVTGYAKSKTGLLRYHVKDVNHKSTTNGLTGYITTNAKYVLPVYYQTSVKKVTVINPSGIKAYNNVNLTGAVRAYKQGTILTVVGIEHHNLTTRFLLSNGNYITANRKMVISGAVKRVKSIKTRTTVNRYKTVNLTGRNGVLKKNKTYKVYGYAYSRPASTKTSGTIRYRVAGGYITANSSYVRSYR